MIGNIVPFCCYLLKEVFGVKREVGFFRCCHLEVFVY